MKRNVNHKDKEEHNSDFMNGMFFVLFVPLW